jgi:hypothetical protein
MANGRKTRWMWIVILLLVLGLVGQWAWYRGQGEQTATEHAAALEETRTDLTQRAESWTQALAERGADGLFRAFAAGVQPAVLAGREEALLQSKNALLQLPEVTFVHILTPDGGVLMSSDEKLTATGEAGARAGWALAAQNLRRREGAAAGVLELAGPIRSGTDPAAVLWIGVDRGRLLSETEPAL